MVHGIQLPVGVLVLALLAPGSASAQQGWSVHAGAVFARDLRHDNAPAVGPAGAQLRLFGPSAGDWIWGGSVTYHRFGRFDYAFAPDFYAERSALVAGVRRRRLGILAPASYAELGVDLVLGMEQVSDADVSRDPGVGGYIGAGLSARSGAVRPFAELGLQGIAVTGELTDTGGVYLLLTLGVSF